MVPMWVQIVGALFGLVVFAVGMAVVHASLVGAFEGQPLMIVTAAALLIALVASAYLTDRKNRP
jgi:ABC-type amino acid transport system permease subunit